MTYIKPESKFSLKKRKIEDPGLLNSLNNELPKNSAVVNKVLKGSTALIGPISKSIDYVLVGALSIVIYNLVNKYML